MSYYEFAEQGSGKFWEIQREGDQCRIRFGKIGSQGQSQVKSFASEAAAQKEHDKLVAEKVKKGYVLQGEATQEPPQMPEPTPAPPPTEVKAVPMVAPSSGSLKAWTAGTPGEPEFAPDFEILRKAVLQMTDIKTNKNKYYAVELHQAPQGQRVFTHYGRTDDLESNPKAGQRECRYLNSLVAAEREYQRIYREKTGKGYREVSLASSRIGSQRAVGTSSGEVDLKTLEKIHDPTPQPTLPPLESELADLVNYLYSEATSALTSTVQAKITADGIETPLGILTIGQIEKGESILAQLYQEFQAQASSDRLMQLSGQFYSAIPHRLGRSRTALEAAVINNLAEFAQKQETLQLMKDMLQVNGEKGNVLFQQEVRTQYEALGCHISRVEGAEFERISDYVIKSQVKSHSIKVKRIFQLRREAEWQRFRGDIPNQQLLFHGSRLGNWVGLLSRGILLPKIVVSLGVKRTDPGWLGSGIYFGSNACTAAFYTQPGKRGTRLMALAQVALGQPKDYTQITYGLEGPPPGYDSCHGVRNRPGLSSQFADDEWVVYELDRQRLEYLVEFTH